MRNRAKNGDDVFRDSANVVSEGPHVGIFANNDVQSSQKRLKAETKNDHGERTPLFDTHQDWWADEQAPTDFNYGVVMGIDLFESFDEFMRKPCHFQDCPDEAMGNRRKGSNEVEEYCSGIRSARDGELVHVCIHHEDVVHHEATSDAFLGMM